MELLRAKCFSSASHCSLCNKVEETLDHVLTKCYYVTLIWYALRCLFHSSFDLSNRFSHLFKSAMKLIFSSQLSAIWRVGIYAGIWNIWHARNTMIFHESFTFIASSVHSICKSIKESETFKSGNMNSQAELLVLKWLHIFLYPALYSYYYSDRLDAPSS